MSPGIVCGGRCCLLLHEKLTLHRCIAIMPLIPVHSLNELLLFIYFLNLFPQREKPATSRTNSFVELLCIYNSFHMTLTQIHFLHCTGNYILSGFLFCFLSLTPNVMILFYPSSSVSAFKILIKF